MFSLFAKKLKDQPTPPKKITLDDVNHCLTRFNNDFNRLKQLVQTSDKIVLIRLSYSELIEQDYFSGMAEYFFNLEKNTQDIDEKRKIREICQAIKTILAIQSNFTKSISALNNSNVWKSLDNQTLLNNLEILFSDNTCVPPATIFPF